MNRTQDTPAVLMEKLLRAVEAKDLTAIAGLYAEGAVLVDPHYPVPRMEGREAILEGLRWAFPKMKSFGFVVVHSFTSADGGKAVVEVDSHHVLEMGMKLDFSQVFVIETQDGLITRLRAYPPYGPGGVGALVLGLSRLWRRLRSAIGTATSVFKRKPRQGKGEKYDCKT